MMHGSIKDIFKIAPLFFLLILGGCWMSAEPLLDGENASAFPYAGQYRSPGNDPEPGVISSGEEDKTYRLTVGSESQEMHFLDLGDDWFVLQGVDPAEEPEEVELGPDLKGTRQPTGLAVYRLVHHVEGSLRIYEPECSAALAAIEGVEQNDTVCEFSSLASLGAAAKFTAMNLEAGEIELPFDELKPWDTNAAPPADD